MELDPGNAVNKKDQKALADLKIVDTLVGNAIREERFEAAVTNLTALLKDCVISADRICLKIDCLMKSFQFDEANKFSAECMKRSELCNNPRILCARGKVLVYNGADVLGKKHFAQALSYDPDLKECQVLMKNIKKSLAMKEEASLIFKTGDYAAAIVKFQECLTIDTMNSQYNAAILLNISICEDKQGKKQDALRTLNKALKYNPKYAKALCKRGDMRMALEEYEEAVRDYSEASDHDRNGFGVQAKLKDAQAKAKKAKRKDYYKILGVSKDVQDPEINKAYKKLALKWHPDKNAGCEEQAATAKKRFQEINEAKAVLTDREKRDQYDQGFDLDEINSGKAGGGMGGGMGGMDPHDLFSMFMGGGGGGMGGMGGRSGRSGGGGASGAPPGFTFRFG